MALAFSFFGGVAIVLALKQRCLEVDLSASAEGLQKAFSPAEARESG